jgi:hypothetical protein
MARPHKSDKRRQSFLSQPILAWFCASVLQEIVVKVRMFGNFLLVFCLRLT